MTNGNLFEFFKETVKKYEEGELYNFDLWLQKNGINPRYINLYHFERYFINNPDLTIGFKDHFEFIAKIVGSYMQDREKLYHIPIIGVKGSGKSLLANLLYFFIGKSGREIKASLSKAGELRIFAKAEENSKPGLANKQGVRIIDECEKEKDIVGILKGYYQYLGNLVYITIWTPEAWIANKDKIYEILPYQVSIGLSNIIDQTQQTLFLKRIIKAIMSQEENDSYPDFFDSVQLENNTYGTRIFQMTQGNPLLTIKVLLACVEQVFRKDKEKLDEKIIYDVIKSMDLIGFKTRMKNLSTTHLKILSVILRGNYDRGTSQKQIAEALNLAKSTISYHINDVLIGKSDLLIVKREGQYSCYKVKENLIPFLQEMIWNDNKNTLGISDSKFQDFMKAWKEKNL